MPICIKAHVKPEKIEQEPAALRAAVSLFIFVRPLTSTEAFENKTHCFALFPDIFDMPAKRIFLSDAAAPSVYA
jgi:hypothetical protein